MLGHKERLKQQQVLASTSSAISGAIDNLARQIKALEVDIRTAEDGEAEYSGIIRRLEERKKELEARIVENSEWIEAFDRNIGPFKDKYDILVKEIEGLYGEAKEKHAKGIDMLVEEFAYHPAYRRFNDRFTATPFTPS